MYGTTSTCLRETNLEISSASFILIQHSAGTFVSVVLRNHLPDLSEL